MPRVEKNGERLSYDLSANGNGVIEKQLLSFGRQIAPQFARRPSQSNKELRLRLRVTSLLGIHLFSAPVCRGPERRLFAARHRAAKSELWSAPRTLAYLAGGSWVCVEPGALSGLPPGM
jgi:hypothetical protein